MSRRRVPLLAMGLATLVLTVSVLMLGGCANRAAYEGLRQGGREACRNKSPEAARAACLANLDDNYDSYNEERQSAREEQQRTEAARKVCYDLPDGADRSDCLKRAR